MERFKNVDTHFGGIEVSEMLDKKMHELVHDLWESEEPYTDLKFCEVHFEYKFDEKSFPKLAKEIQMEDILSDEELSEDERKRLLKEIEEEPPTFEQSDPELIAEVAARRPSFVLGGEAVATLSFSLPRHIMEDAKVETIDDAIELFDSYIKELKELKELAAKHGVTFKSDHFIGFKAEHTVPFKPDETPRQVLSKIERDLEAFRGKVDEYE